ncbi:MAG: DUF4350 domain-containing protein, partial [Planctomycetaceae bacterium]
MLPEENCVLLVLGPDVYPTQQQQSQLSAWVRGGGCLVFAHNLRDQQVELPELGISIGKLSVHEGSDGVAQLVEEVADAGQSSDVRRSQKQAQQRSTPSVAPPGAVPAAEQLSEQTEIRTVQVTVDNELSGGPVTYSTRSRLSVPAGLQSQPLVRSATAGDQVLEVRCGYGRVLVCSTADLFSNRTLLDRAGRRLAVRLLERARRPLPADDQNYWQPAFDGDRIELSEYFNAADSYRSTGVLLSPAMRIGTLQLLLVAVLAIWLAFHRFGPTVAAE